MKHIIFLSVLMSICSCAVFVKDERQLVRFKGGDENGVTKIVTPDGSFDIENGNGSYLLTRSKSDVPIKVYCPDGTKKEGIIYTEFDMLASGLGAFLMWPIIGNAIDAVSNKAYDYPEVSLYSYCKQNKNQRDIASSKK